MNTNTTSAWNWLNPLFCLQTIYAFFTALITDILKLFGLAPRPATDDFENIQAKDVEDAAAGAVEREASADALFHELSPAQVVHAYAQATEEQRAVMDLGQLSQVEQDWLLGLSDTDLVLLGASGMAACARSLRDRAVLTNPKRLRGGDFDMSDKDSVLRPDDDDREAANRGYISARFQALMSAPAGTNPHHKPVSLSRH